MRKYTRFNNIRFYMNRNGYTIPHLVTYTGISRSSLERYINKKSIPNVADAIVLANVLGVTVYQLFDLPPDKNVRI